MDTKVCTKCQQELPLSSFYLSRGKPKSYCKSCDASYKRSPDALRSRKTRYAKKYLARLRANSPEYRAKKAEQDRAYRQSTAGKLAKLRAKAKRRQRGGEHILTVQQWEKIVSAFNGRCAYCLEEKPLTADHFIPIAHGGVTAMGNIVCACVSCNSSKQHKFPQDWCSELQLERILDILATL